MKEIIQTISRKLRLSINCLVGVVVISATAEQKVLDFIPGLDKVFEQFSVWKFSVAAWN